MGKQGQPDPSPINRLNSKNWTMAPGILPLFRGVISFSKTTSPVTLSGRQLQFLLVNLLPCFYKEFVSSVTFLHYNKSASSEYYGGERVRKKGSHPPFRKAHLHIIQVQGKASGIKPKFLSKSSKTL